MRVAMIGNHWHAHSGGGMERYFSGLVRQLSENGDDVNFFTLGDPPQEYHGATGIRIAPQEVGTLKRTLLARKTFSDAFKAPYDVVNPHFALTSLPALPSLPKRARVVATFHGPWALESVAEGQNSLSTRLKMHVERFVLKRASRYITVSDAFGDLLSDLHRIDRSSISTVPLGIDTNFFTPVDRDEARRQLGWPIDRRIVFTARRLIARVGIRELITAIEHLPERADLWFGIAGRGALHDELSARLHDKKLAADVKLLGFLSEEQLALAYAAADVVILPSQRLEGFGSVIAESLACGTPVIVTPIGGMPEFIHPISPQLITADASAESIAATLQQLAEGRLALPSRTVCREYAVRRFAWPSIAASVREIFAAAD